MSIYIGTELNKGQMIQLHAWNWYFKKSFWVSWRVIFDGLYPNDALLAKNVTASYISAAILLKMTRKKIWNS